MHNIGRKTRIDPSFDDPQPAEAEDTNHQTQNPKSRKILAKSGKIRQNPANEI